MCISSTTSAWRKPTRLGLTQLDFPKSGPHWRMLRAPTSGIGAIQRGTFPFYPVEGLAVRQALRFSAHSLHSAMASLNKVLLIGNLTRDPDLKYTPKGQAICEIGMAMNRRYLVDGEKREEVTYVDVTFWGKGAEIINQYMKKGSPIYVEGRLKLDSWDDKETGKKQSRLRITGEEFQFLGGKNESGGGQGGGSYDEEGGSSRGSGSGGYSQNRPPQNQPRPPQSSAGYDNAPPRGNQSNQNNGPRPDAFPPGLDDDEIPF